MTNLKSRGQELLVGIQELVDNGVKKTYIAERIGISRQLLQSWINIGYVTPYYRDKVQTFLIVRANQKYS